jgi:hypothetical protein
VPSANYDVTYGSKVVIDVGSVVDDKIFIHDLHTLYCNNQHVTIRDTRLSHRADTLFHVDICLLVQLGTLICAELDAEE